MMFFIISLIVISIAYLAWEWSIAPERNDYD